MGMGGLFIVLGLALIFWDKSNEKRYYDSFSTSVDVRKYLDHWPPHPGFGAIRIGGLIAIAVGLVMIIAGGVLWLRG